MKNPFEILFDVVAAPFRFLDSLGADPQLKEKKSVTHSKTWLLGNPVKTIEYHDTGKVIEQVVSGPAWRRRKTIRVKSSVGAIQTCLACNWDVASTKGRFECPKCGRIWNGEQKEADELQERTQFDDSAVPADQVASRQFATSTGHILSAADADRKLVGTHQQVTQCRRCGAVVDYLPRKCSSCGCWNEQCRA